MYQIFDYWKDKCITANGDVEIDYGYPGCVPEKIKDSVAVVDDWGEPSCFACGKSLDLETVSGYNNLLENNNLKQIWNTQFSKSGFQKAHIIAASLGGRTIPENMFCLCETCHKNSPDTIYKKQFFRWIYNRKMQPKYPWNYTHEALEELSSLNIPFSFIDPSSFNKDNVTCHCGSVSESSIVACWVGNAEEKYNDRMKTIKEFHNQKEAC